MRYKKQSRIAFLFKYAREHGYLLCTGAKLYELQFDAFEKNEAFNDAVLELRDHYGYDNSLYYYTWSLEKQESYHKEYLKIQNKYSVRRPAILRNYFYSLLNNAAKSGQIKRFKLDGRWMYTIPDIDTNNA